MTHNLVNPVRCTEYHRGVPERLGNEPPPELSGGQDLPPSAPSHLYNKERLQPCCPTAKLIDPSRSCISHLTGATTRRRLCGSAAHIRCHLRQTSPRNTEKSRRNASDGSPMSGMKHKELDERVADLYRCKSNTPLERNGRIAAPYIEQHREENPFY